MDSAGPHGDALTKVYKTHQRWQSILAQRQAERRDRAVEQSLKSFLVKERREWNRFVEPVHDRLARTFDDQGRVMTSAEAQSLRKHMVETRGEYWDPKSKRRRKLREQTYVFDEAGKPLRNDKGKKIRVDVPLEKVKRVFHESAQLDPRASRMLVLAARAGVTFDPIIIEYLSRVSAAGCAALEKATGVRCHSRPYHPKALGGHIQPEGTFIDEHGHFHAGARDRVHLGKAMIGAWRWREMDFKGVELDALTGRVDSEVGLDDALANRGALAVDLAMVIALDVEHETVMAEPEFAALRPFWDRACRDYDAYLDRRRAVIAAEQTGTREKAEALERAKKAENEANQAVAAKANAEATAAAEREKAEAAAQARALAEQAGQRERQLAKANRRRLAELTGREVLLSVIKCGAAPDHETATKLGFSQTSTGAWVFTGELAAVPANDDFDGYNGRVLAFQAAANAWRSAVMKSVGTALAAKPIAPEVDEKVPAVAQAELEQLRAANAKLTARNSSLEKQVADLQSLPWRTWSTEEMAASIERVAFREARAGDECLLDKQGRVSALVRRHLYGVVHSAATSAEDRVYAAEALERAMLHDRMCEDEGAKGVLGARGEDVAVEQKRATGREDD